MTQNGDPQSPDSYEEVLRVTRKLTQLAAGGDYIYRGESECYPKVCSTLYREYPDLAEHFDIELVQRSILETASHFVGQADENDLLTQMQHYGCSTNLIDFTTDYNIALFFACSGATGKDGRVIFLQRDNQPLIRPATPANRVIAQKSVFVRPRAGFVEPSQVVDVPSGAKAPILDHLNRCHGLSVASVYNDLHGFIKYHQSQQTAYSAFYTALEHLRLRQLDKAIEYFGRAIALNPSQAEAYVNRGVAHRKIGDLARALSDYDKAVALEPQWSATYSNRGNLHSSMNNHERAIRDHKRAIELSPNSATNYSDRATSYKRMGNYDLAILDYTTAIGLNPRIAAIYDNRGTAYSAKGEHDLAIRDHDKAIQLNPHFALAHNNLGCARFRKGDYKRAVQDFDRAIELNPDRALAYYNRAQCHMCLDDWKRAASDLNDARRRGLDIARAFASEFRSVSAFEAHHRVRVPAGIYEVLALQPRCNS